ncbi:MAG: hypothetical protein V1874_02765 [Spirochaetota bacterium]
MKRLFRRDITAKSRARNGIVFSLVYITVTAMISVLVGCWGDDNPPASPAYTNASLNGNYLVMMTEVENPSGTITYTETAGTFSFNGAGSVTVSGSDRDAYSDGSTPTTSTKTETIPYSVNADGSFILNPSGGKPVHGQIAMNGKSLLFDGSSQGNSVDYYLNHGIAMKRVSSGTPPTYTNASLSGDYLFTMIEVLYSVDHVVYNEISGTMSFGGAGSGNTNGTKRSSETGLTTTITNDPFTYTVNADGSFLIPGGKPLHGQIVLDGSSLLLDGTQLGGDGTLYLNHAVAMKRVNSGTVPTYNNASLNGDYLLMFTEIYSESAGIVTYKEGAGTMSFNGAGSVMASGPDRHSYSDGSAVITENKTETIPYSVDSSGYFILNPSVNPTHGQIVLDGNCLLLDGTMLNSTDGYLGHGLVMKR